MSYSIGEVADLTGVKPVTLRAWESRYGLVTPSRAASSYRRYTRRDVQVLARMRALVASGVPARRAARLSARPPAADLPADFAAAAGGPAALQDLTAIARAGGAFDTARLRRVLDEAFAVSSVEAVVDRWLLPSMARVGRAWAAGDLDVASEHVISAAVMRKLSALFEATPARGPRVVVGLPEHARHEVPALAFALLLQRAGAQVLYAGADVPAGCWQRIARAWQPSAAVIAATCERDAAAAGAGVAALDRCEVAPVFAGGRAAGQVAGAIPLPSPLSAAATAVTTALAHRRRAR